MIKNIISNYKKNQAKSENEQALKAIFYNDIETLQILKSKNYNFNDFSFCFQNAHSFIKDSDFRKKFMDAGAAFSYEADNLDLTHSHLNLIAFSVFMLNDMEMFGDVDYSNNAFSFLLQNGVDPFLKENNEYQYYIPATVIAAALNNFYAIKNIFDIPENIEFINKTYHDKHDLLYYLPFGNQNSDALDKTIDILEYLINKGADHHYINGEGQAFFKNSYNMHFHLDTVKKIQERLNLLALNKNFLFYSLLNNQTQDYVLSLNIPIDTDYQVQHNDVVFSEILLFEASRYSVDIDSNGNYGNIFSRVLPLYGNNFNYQNEEGETLLHFMGRNNDLKNLLRFVADDRVDINITDKKGNNFLHHIIDAKKHQERQYLELAFSSIIPSCLFLDMNMNICNNEGTKVSDYLSMELKSLIRKHESQTLKSLLHSNDDNNFVHKKRI